MTRRGNLLIETGLLHDYFGNFFMQGERYYIYLNLTWGAHQVRFNPREVRLNPYEVRLNPYEVRLKQTSENSETRKTQISFLGGEGCLQPAKWGEVPS